jgi:hypothetical protein
MSELVIKSSNPHYIANREKLLDYQKKYNKLNPKQTRYYCTVCKRKGEQMVLMNGTIARLHREIMGHEFVRETIRVKGQTPVAVTA